MYDDLLGKKDAVTEVKEDPIVSESISFNWDPVTFVDLIGYNVYYKEEKDPGSFKKIDVGNKTSITVKGLKPKTTYKFCVSAYSKNLESGMSNELTHTTRG